MSNVFNEVFTFEQQRHEGDFGRLHFLESVSVGFMIHGWILRKKSDQSLYVTDVTSTLFVLERGFMSDLQSAAPAQRKAS